MLCPFKMSPDLVNPLQGGRERQREADEGEEEEEAGGREKAKNGGMNKDAREVGITA